MAIIVRPRLTKEHNIKEHFDYNVIIRSLGFITFPIIS